MTTLPISISNAQSNLTHYITMLMEEAGLTVDSDTYAELDEIITPVFEELSERIAQLAERIDKIERPIVLDHVDDGDADYADYIDQRERDHLNSAEYGSDEDRS